MLVCILQMIITCSALLSLLPEATMAGKGLDIDIASKFQQNDYHITPERAELVRYNKAYIKHASITTFKYNRSCAALNASITYNVDVTRIEGIAQVYKFMSNEYREFPMRLQLNFCKALNANILGLADVTKCGNFTGCPLQKGRNYYICNWTINESKFPPYFPTGRYMMELQLLYFDAEAALARAYIEISRPIVKK